MLFIALTVLSKVQLAPVITNPDGTPKHFGRIYLRAFKYESEMEVWATEGESIKYNRVAVYPIAAMSGHLGPKLHEGDKQVPEGVYKVEKYNPDSAFHLSMGIDYPNESDKVRSDPLKPGAAIFIHGNTVSAGCMAMTDPIIEKLYDLCQVCDHPEDVRVHIFPTRMTKANTLKILRVAEQPEAKLWTELEKVYSAFQHNYRLPVILVQPDGAYKVVSTDW